ncbi:MAG TPA: flagellar hook-basal body complex protein [Devosiaceae bacterium]
MGIYGALATAVTGLQAQSFALENISGNIANSQTTGYKRTETDFLDMIPDLPTKQQVPGAVLGFSRSTNDVQGDIKAAAQDTYMAINGSGFFVVENKIGENDGGAVFGGADYYTRRGDFSVDKDGYLVNGAGYYLKGLPVDASTGNISGSVPEVIRLSNAFLPAEPTTTINYQLNLPQLPKNASYDPAVAGSELLAPADYAADPTTAGTGVISAADSDTFLKQSTSGGAISVYAPNGSQANVQLRWAKVDSAATGGSDTWNLFYLSDSTATGTDPMWTNAGVDYTFGANGSLNPAISSTTIPGLTVNGTAIGDVKLLHGAAGVTQFSDSNGTSKVTQLTQNGYPAGEFTSVAVNDSGRIVASYSNGQQVELSQVVTADFNAANQLKQMNGGIYQATSESGGAIINTNGGVVGSSLESSNTDISQEFTKLIVTQQAYAAGTKIVSTSDQMLQQALNMIR